MPRTRRKLTDEQRAKFQEARKYGAELQEHMERFAELFMCCDCEDNPSCPACRLFALAGPLEHRVAAVRDAIDRELDKP